jgi:hypothetical protein
VTNELICFPEPGAKWVDAGEGNGMYVMATLPRPNDYPDKCTIENFIVITQPDAAVSDLRDFWGDPKEQIEDEQARSHAARLLEREGYAMKASQVRSLISQGSLSIPVLFAADMGSTDRTLAARDGGALWEAGWDDLTPTGILLMDRLRVAFGNSVRLLTFLDT